MQRLQKTSCRLSFFEAAQIVRLTTDLAFWTCFLGLSYAFSRTSLGVCTYLTEIASTLGYWKLNLAQINCAVMLVPHHIENAWNALTDALTKNKLLICEQYPLPTPPWAWDETALCVFRVVTATLIVERGMVCHTSFNSYLSSLGAPCVACRRKQGRRRGYNRGSLRGSLISPYFLALPTPPRLRCYAAYIFLSF